jgi:chaperone modulatory protein CbpM
VNLESAEAHSFDERDEISLSQLLELSGLPEDALRELVDYGALAPVDPEVSVWTFSARSVIVARTARRLREDFELETDALSVVLALVERVGALESELRALRARSSCSS